MSEMKRDAALREIFKAALTSDAQEIDPTQDHPVDNDGLLIDWSVGHLDATRHRAVLDHLTECSYCRRELAKMIQAGALVLPEHGDVEDVPDVRKSAATARRDWSNTSSKRNLLIAATAIAASLLVAVIWGLSGRGGDSMLAMAISDMEAGRHTIAMERMEGYLDENKNLADDDRAEARRILEESGYRLARRKLEGSEADRLKRVIDIEARASGHGGSSGRLSNLRIQAQRGEDHEYSLASRGRLLDYGVTEDGFHKDAGIKSIFADPPSRTDKRIADQFTDAIKKHPNSLDLHLNFGQFLIEQNDFEQAAKQFTAAVRLDPNSTLAQTGLGLALFQQDTDETIELALGHFQKAVELSPDDLTANLNLAVCLTRLGRKDEANTCFQKALELTQDDERTRKQLENWLR